MKSYLRLLPLVIGLAALITACSKSGVDTSKLQRAFGPAEAELKAGVDKAVAAVKAQDYQGALAALQEVAAKAKLTPEQQQAIQEVIAQVQAKIAELAGKASEGATKAIGDIQNALPK
jgi:hypothetical protein